MKKLLLLLICCCASTVGFGEKLPDNIYFRAMKDEMKRTLHQLKRPGVPRPFYVAYKLENIRPLPKVEASLGALYPSSMRDERLNVYTILDIGTAKEDSMGYAHEAYWDYAYAPAWIMSVSKSYDGLRQALWETTDEAYLFAAEVYQQKQAYKRQKNLPQNKPDFVPHTQTHFVEDTPEFRLPPTEQLQTWAQTLSTPPNTATYLEQFTVFFDPIQKEVYYLNSLGGFYHWSFAAVRVVWTARLRNKDGYKKELSKTLWLADMDSATETQLREQTDEFLQQVADVYHAKKATTYIGPVLLTAHAAGQFIKQAFVLNMQNITPLLSAKNETDNTAGKLRDKLELRVLSNVVNVYDRPTQRTFNGIPLSGFMPVDDEGVSAEELSLVTGGKLRALPRSSRPAEKGLKSNGHARLAPTSLPRENLTNVFVEAQQPVSAEELEQQLLEKCKALELEYCYILPSFPTNGAAIPAAQRVYTKDGHKETVYGLKLADLTPRALRDIMAAGNDPEILQTVLPSSVKQTVPTQSIITPSLLLEELELVPDDAKPDKPPFVSKPN